MTHIKVNGLIFKLIGNVFFLLLISSCSPNYSRLSKYNYYNKNYFYNDSLKIGIDFDNDVEFVTFSNIKNRELKKISKDLNITTQNLFLITQSKEKKQKTYYFFEHKNEAASTSSFREIYSSLKKEIVFEKQKNNLKIIGLIKSLDNGANVSNEANNVLAKIIIDTLDSKKLSYFSIFNNYFSDDHPNDLLAIKKMLQAPKILEMDDRNKNKFQLLATINSHIQNSKTFDSLINSYEKKRKEKYNHYIETIADKSDIYKNEDVFNKIEDIAKENNIIMLNEDHYYSEHRIFGMEILNVLKKNGYKYISLEAFNISDKSSFIPNKENGPYISEPYFSHFIREAKKLDFTILGHENYDENINRELGQAKNILKILEHDPSAKIFIYVGHSHIEKENNKYKWMAQYFKEISKINPITINQVAVCADNNVELMLLPRSYFQDDFDTGSSADYFLINNIKSSLKRIYDERFFRKITIENKKIKEYRNQQVLVEILDSNEFYLIKKSAVPIESFLITPKGKTISCELPLGKYHLYVKTANNEIIYDDEVIVQ